MNKGKNGGDAMVNVHTPDGDDQLWSEKECQAVVDALQCVRKAMEELHRARLIMPAGFGMDELNQVDGPLRTFEAWYTQALDCSPY